MVTVACKVRKTCYKYSSNVIASILTLIILCSTKSTKSEPVSSLPSVTGSLTLVLSISCADWGQQQQQLLHRLLLLDSRTRFAFVGENLETKNSLNWFWAVTTSQMTQFTKRFPDMDQSCTSVCVWLAVCVYLCYCHSDTLWLLDLLLGSKVMAAQQSVFSGKTDAVLVPTSELSPNFLLHQSWWEKAKLRGMSHIWGDSDRSKDSYSFTRLCLPSVTSLPLLIGSWLSDTPSFHLHK